MLYFRAGLWYQFSGTGFRRCILVCVSWALSIIKFSLTVTESSLQRAVVTSAVTAHSFSVLNRVKRNS